MFEAIGNFLSSDDLSPHGICLIWRPELIWTHVIADAIIGGAYFSIPLVLSRVAAKRPDFGFGWVLWGFVAFILACGTTHFMSILTLWLPEYGVEALIKVITAAASVIIAIMLWPLLPQVLRMPSPEQWRVANESLALRVQERDEALLALRRESEERRRIESMLWQAQKIESLGQLTGGIAHDFNNLLTAIQISLERAAKLSGGGEPKLQKALDLATIATTKAGELTNRMLAFARKQPLRPARLDVAELLSELSPLLHNILGENRNLVIDVDRRGVEIFADRNQLEQALLNLAVNARDAMPDGGALIIKAHMMDSSVGDGAMAIIQVEDNGVGMSEDVRSRAFEPFFTTKAVGEGSGLGLSQVHGFIEQSRGKIYLDSHPGKGTRVSIELPVPLVPVEA
jgi:signal transduction histidine kinase